MFTRLKRIFQRRKSYAVPREISEKQKVAQFFADHFRFERTGNEPLPPWLKHPQILIGSIGWRMGAGEDYLFETFYPFWQSMNVEQQGLYIEKFDMGENWPDREKWITSLDRNKIPPPETPSKPT